VWHVSVKVEGVFHSLACILVPKVLDVDSGFVDGVTQAKEVTEFINELRSQGQPSRGYEAG